MTGRQKVMDAWHVDVTWLDADGDLVDRSALLDGREVTALQESLLREVLEGVPLVRLRAERLGANDE